MFVGRLQCSKTVPNIWRRVLYFFQTLQNAIIVDFTGFSGLTVEIYCLCSLRPVANNPIRCLLLGKVTENTDFMCRENLGPREFETSLPENICWITERSMTAFGNLVVQIASDVPHLSVGTACKNHADCSYGYFNIWAFSQSETRIYCSFLYEWVDSACFAPLSMWEFHDTGNNVLRNQTAFLERIRVPYRHFSS